MTFQDELEQMIRQRGLNNIMTVLSIICATNAERTAVKWQDAHAAKEWAKYGDAIDSAIVKMWGRL